VTDEYPPFLFTGTPHRGAYDVSGEPVIGHEAEIRIALACQQPARLRAPWSRG